MPSRGRSEDTASTSQPPGRPHQTSAVPASVAPARTRGTAKYQPKESNQTKYASSTATSRPKAQAKGTCSGRPPAVGGDNGARRGDRRVTDRFRDAGMTPA